MHPKNSELYTDFLGREDRQMKPPTIGRRDIRIDHVKTSHKPVATDLDKPDGVTFRTAATLDVFRLERQ